MEKKLKDVSLDDVLQYLGIAEYKDEIFSSNSHEELFHLHQYYELYKELDDTTYFSMWFNAAVELSKESSSRPKSFYQHARRLFFEHLIQLKDEEKES